MTVKEVVDRFRKPALPLLALVALLVAGCSNVGGQQVTFWDIIWSMIFFYFMFMAIWIWISVMCDIFAATTCPA